MKDKEASSASEKSDCISNYCSSEIGLSVDNFKAKASHEYDEDAWNKDVAETEKRAASCGEVVSEMRHH